METWKSFFTQSLTEKVDISNLIQLINDFSLTFIGEKHRSEGPIFDNELCLIKSFDPQTVQIGFEHPESSPLTQRLNNYTPLPITNGIKQGQNEPYFSFFDRYESKMLELILKSLNKNNKKSLIIVGEDHLRPTSGIPYKKELADVPRVIIYQKTEDYYPHIAKLKDGVYNLSVDESHPSYKKAKIFLIKGSLR
ncbi:MAG: hypothetical protein KJ623_00065 [Nanoarchaeota archaeon]|nr:hypothetical protein [Nanoarchaeota archaeon]MBU0962361.1 hypothetical protein [Nanoarchaeota archaeon]